MIFQKRSHRGGSQAPNRLGDCERGRNRKVLKKPNSFSQVENLHQQAPLPEKSPRSSIESNSNSNHESTVMVPKLSKSDLASYLNEGND